MKLREKKGERCAEEAIGTRKDECRLVGTEDYEGSGRIEKGRYDCRERRRKGKNRPAIGS